MAENIQTAPSEISPGHDIAEEMADEIMNRISNITDIDVPDAFKSEILSCIKDGIMEAYDEGYQDGLEDSIDEEGKNEEN